MHGLTCIVWANLTAFSLQHCVFIWQLQGAKVLELEHYVTQPLVELYGGCMVVLKVS
jgi:hypothetical protein